MNKLALKPLSILFLLFTFFFSSQVFASELSSAKDAGLIGEQANGYLGIVVSSAPAAVKSLVKTVNGKRKARYKQIAKSKKIALSEVEKVGGATAISKTKSGNYIMSAGSGWKKK